MKLCLLSISDKMPAWVDQVTQDYAKRLSNPIQFEMLALPAPKRGAHLSEAKAKALEAQLILSKIPDNAHVVLLDEQGKMHSSIELSKQLEKWQNFGKPTFIVIGGADGFDESVYERAQERWSLSALTFPHPLVRVIAVEQLYRASSILKGHPYHRE